MGASTPAADPGYEANRSATGQRDRADAASSASIGSAARRCLGVAAASLESGARQEVGNAGLLLTGRTLFVQLAARLRACLKVRGRHI